MHDKGTHPTTEGDPMPSNRMAAKPMAGEQGRCGGDASAP